MSWKKMELPGSSRIARFVSARIERGGDRVWRLEDFQDLPFSPAARALSRVAHLKVIERLSRGVYYRARPTAFGTSRPNPAAISKLASERKDVLLSDLLRRVDGSDAVADGVRFRFPATPDTWSTPMHVIDAERQCCRFLRFSITVEPDCGPIDFELPGPAE